MNKFLMLNRGCLHPKSITNAKLLVAEIEKDRRYQTLFREDFFSNPPRHWEVRYDNAYPNVIYDPKYKKYRCYYSIFSRDTESETVSLQERRGRTYGLSPGRVSSLCYAESDDGVHWIKPNLGMVEFNGSYDNNILFLYVHGVGVFLDEEETDPSRRYKLVTKMAYMEGPPVRGFMAVNFSEDGIHWGEMIPWPHENPVADTHNFPFRDRKDGLFKVITRTWRDGERICSICTSRDFINWSAPREILQGNGFASQVYSMPVFWYDGIYLGLASIYHEGEREAKNFDTVDCELAYATQTDHFNHVSPGQHFIPRGCGSYPDGEFDCGCIYAAAPIDMGDRLCFYYMGGNGLHTGFRETSFARGFLKKDEFAWYEPADSAREARISTAKFSIVGDYLAVLAKTVEDGYWSAAVCPDWNAEPYAGFHFNDCILTPDENGYTRISYSGGKLTDLAADRIHIVFRFYNTRLYAIKGDLICEM